MARRSPLPLRRPSLLQSLKRRLEAPTRRVAVLAVGSRLRGDDAAGLLVADALVEQPPAVPADRFAVFIGETAPENLTGELKRFAPTHLVIVDAAHLGLRPGAARLIDTPDDIDGLTASTHVLPLNVLLKYLRASFAFEALVIGIEPRSLEFGAPPTAAVVRAAARVAAAIRAAVL